MVQNNINIFILPDEIVTRITLFIDEIFSLENWLAINKKLQYNFYVDLHRMTLTIHQNTFGIYFDSCNSLVDLSNLLEKFDYMNIVQVERYWTIKLNYLFKYKFYSKRFIKRGGKRFYRKDIQKHWHQIECEKGYEWFMKRYKFLWFH